MQPNDLMQQWADANQSMMESIKQLGEINTSVMSKLTERQMEAVNTYMDSVNKQLESMKDVKNVQEVMNAQASLAQEFSEQMLSNARQTMDVLMETRTDLNSWLEQGIEKASGNLKK